MNDREHTEFVFVLVIAMIMDLVVQQWGYPAWVSAQSPMPLSTAVLTLDTAQELLLKLQLWSVQMRWNIF